MVKILEEQRACCAGARVGRPFNIIKRPVGRKAWTQPCCNLHDFHERFPLVGDENGVFGQAWTLFGHCLDRFGHCFGAFTGQRFHYIIFVCC